MIFQEVPLNVVLTIYSEDIDEDYIYGKIVMRNEEEVIIAQIMIKVRVTVICISNGKAFIELIMNQVMRKKLNDYIRQKINIMKN